MCQLVLSALSFICLVLAGTSSVAGQPGDLKTTAKQYVTDGLKAQAAGRYEEAISLYNKAYELVPHPELLFNLGQAHRLKGEKAIALNYYQKYLAVDSRGRGATEASQWATQIDLELRAEADALRQAEEDRKTAAEAEHKAAAARRAAQARESEANRNRKEEFAATLSQQVELKEAPSQGTSSPSIYDHEAPRILTTKRIIALGLGAGALVAGGFGLYYRAQALDSYDMYKQEVEIDEVIAEPYREEANRKALISGGFVIVGSVALGVGIVLWLTGADDRKLSAQTTSRWTPIVDREMAGLAYLGGF